MAALKGEIVKTEIEVSVLELTVEQNNFELLTKRRTLNEMQRQYNQLAQRSDQIARNAGPMHAVSDIPGLALEFYRLFREVTVQNKIFENIYPQYDIQKLKLSTSRRGLQILSEPHLPTYKDGPKRAFIVLAGMVFSIFLSLLIIFYLNTMDTGSKTNSDTYHKINQIKKNLSFRSQ